MKEKLEMLQDYIDTNVSPILVDFVDFNDSNKVIALPATASLEELNGHYEGTEYVAPKWFNDLEKISKTKNTVLLIDKIDTIAKEDQLKFVEILKYRKIGTFDLPSNCVIILSANKVNKDTINEEIFSLVAKI